LLAEEAATVPIARERLASGTERDTILTDVFDVATHAAWPKEFRGRALVNAFARTWDGRSDALAHDEAELRAFAEARARGETLYVYAGQSVGMIRETRPAAAIVREIVQEARACLRAVREIE
jgi:nitronate monooxygenase